MACFWKDLKGTEQTCYESSGFLHGLGNYVYAGYVDPDPDYSLIEVKKDLSGYIKHGAGDVAGFTGASSLFSKGRKVYALCYDTGPNPSVASLYRHNGNGVSVEIAGIPNLSPWGKHVQILQGKLRSVAWPNINDKVFYESSDGETWSALTGVTNPPQEPTDYTVLGSRLIMAAFTGGTFARIWYSDNAGVSWTAGTGITTAITSDFTEFHHSGANVLVFLYGRGIWRSTDGATWTFCTGTDLYGYGSYYPQFVSNGAGTVLFAADWSFSGYSLFGRSTDNGTSWSQRTYAAAGIPEYSVPHGMFWDGAQFVSLFKRGDTATWQVFTSPNGLTWTGGLTIPSIEGSGNVTQIID